jgi:hypothetical protein
MTNEGQRVLALIETLTQLKLRAKSLETSSNDFELGQANGLRQAIDAITNSQQGLGS